jgi:hypothetical protein
VFGHGKKKQVVIAKHDNSPIMNIFDRAENAQGVRAAIDEIADEPKAIGSGVKMYPLEKALQGSIAALHIADRISSHKKSIDR